MNYSADMITHSPSDSTVNGPAVSHYAAPAFDGNERRLGVAPNPSGNDGSINFGRRSGDTYLESAIASASPAKLRMMLIERGVEVARHLAQVWRENPGKRGTNEHSLKLFELLTELLSGVTDDSVEVCRTVADLYVFLCQHLIGAEANGDATMIDEIRLVLETEAETWRMVCMQESGHSPAKNRATELLSGGLNLEA